MEKKEKFLLPSPVFKENEKSQPKLLTNVAVSQETLLPKGPPMYGPRGSTIPPRYLKNFTHNNSKYPPPYERRNDGDHSRGRGRFRGRGRNFHHQDNKNFTNDNCQHQTNNNNNDNTFEKFWCNSCDHSFNFQSDFQEHQLENRICGIDECTFSGHYMAVTKHIEVQHTTGLYDKIKNLNTPEEISKWREERKKRYPTRENVELRQKAAEERNKRGEKLGNNKSRFGNKNDRRQMERNNENRNYDRKKDHRFKESKDSQQSLSKPNGRKRRVHKRSKNGHEIKKIEDRQDITDNVSSFKISIEDEEMFNCGLKRFEGTLAIVDYHTDKNNSSQVNSLTSLSNIYGSTSESESENDKQSDSILKNVGCIQNVQDDLLATKEKDENTNTNILETLSMNQNTINNFRETIDCSTEFKDMSSDNEMPEEKPIGRNCDNEMAIISNVSKEFSTSNDTVKTPTISRKRSKPAKKYNNLLDYSKLKTRRQNSMLEKLLENDIRHERNVLLQCVRFVVKNNFFGIGSKKLS